MFLIIAALYFLGIQSVAPSSCPRLRCTSRRSVDPQDVRYKCSLSTIPHRQPRSPSRRYNVVYSNASTSALVKGLCVSDLHLDNLRLNATRYASSESSTTLQLLLQHLSGLGLKAGEAHMVCNTEPLSDRVSVWERCKRRVPRLEVVERLSLDNSVVCVVCAYGSGDSKLVYHSIAQTVSLRVVFRDPSSPSSTHIDPTPSVILDLRLFTSSSESVPGPNQVSVLTESAKKCRWKCGSLPYCLISASHLCDGIQHCPAGQDEAWCNRPVAARDSGDASESPVLGLPLVYALITLGCVLGFVFLLLCFLWAFCSRPVPPHSSSSSSRHRRRHRARAPRLPPPQPPACPSCSPCPSSRATAVLMEASGTNSSSGVFEESSSCPRCGVRLWLDVKFGEESKGTLGASDTSSAISGCADDSATVETLICSAPNPKNLQQSGSSPRCWTSFNDGRSRGSFESIVCHSAVPVRHFSSHHRPSTRSLRRHAHFQGLNFTMPSHQQDWFLNLPAAVRRSHDDTEPRPVHSPGAESGRLLPPPNLNPFLEEPNFRCQTVAADD